jgi:hypothetical protein
LSGIKTPSQSLWALDLFPLLSPPSAHGATALASLPVLKNLEDAKYVAYVHRSLGSPTLSTFLRAVTKGHLKGFPRLTMRMVRRNPPQSLSTSFGHLDMVRMGLQSSRTTPPSSALTL